jgi:hypothetical protein
MGRERLAPEPGATGTITGKSGTGAVLARDRLLPLAPPMAGLFPEGGLRRGTTVVIGPGHSPGTSAPGASAPGMSAPGMSAPGASAPGASAPGASAPGMTSLALALLSGPCAGGSWCAVVGAPDIGLVAASQLGIDLERLAVVPSPGSRWATVTAALLEGFDVVLLRAASQMGSSDARKLEARARERGSVLAVMGDWPGSAAVRLEVVAGRWCGLEDGCGYLWGREVEVVASGKGAASRPQRARIWFGRPGLGAPGLGPPGLGPPGLGPPELGPVAKLELVAAGVASDAARDTVKAPAGIGIAG